MFNAVALCGIFTFIPLTKYFLDGKLVKVSVDKCKPTQAVYGYAVLISCRSIKDVRIKRFALELANGVFWEISWKSKNFIS